MILWSQTCICASTLYSHEEFLAFRDAVAPNPPRAPTSKVESAAKDSKRRQSHHESPLIHPSSLLMKNMETTRWIQPSLAVLLSFLIASRAYKRKSLSLSGAISGFVVMAIHIFVGYRFGAMLLAFFFTSSKLTKMGEDRKRKVDPEFKEGGQRNWIQVLSNSAIATVLVIILWTLTEGQDRCLNSKDSALVTSLIGGVIGHYSCCNGDTWSSELGILSEEQPRLITTFKPVRRGTNGGVTKAGLLAAAAAGSVIGLSFVLLGLLTVKCDSDIALKQLLVIPISTLAGLFGSVIDSLLGATLQFSGFCTVRNKVVGKPGPTVKKISGLSILDNNAVNFVSILLTSIVTSFACLYIF